MAALPKGQLTITAHKGESLRDVQTIGKQDPYCKLTAGSESFKTKVHDNGGTAPSWEQSFLFNLDGKTDKMNITIYDKGTISDDIIARVDIPLLTLLKEEKQQKIQVIHPNNFTQTAGFVYVTASFKGTGGPAPAAKPASAAPAPAPAPQPQQQVVYVVAPGQQQPQVVYQQQPQVVMAPPKPAGGCPAASKQDKWRWCCKCQVLFYSGLGQGVCPAGGGHDSTGSGQYLANLSAGCSSQNGWRWCSGCQSMFYGGTASVCPLGGSHNSTGSGDYHMCLNAAHGQGNWRWCRKCSGIHYAGLTGICPAGGAHVTDGSGAYAVAHL